MDEMTEPKRQACPSCDGTGLDLYDGTLNPDFGLASCSVCDGRKFVETMIERVARAAEDAMLNPTAHCCSVSIVGDPARFYDVIARAAIAAMREPTEAMQMVTDRALMAAPDDSTGIELANAIWTAMIDSALAETP